MMDSSHTSSRIVDFVAALIPIYMQERVNGISCARCLLDGTLILPCVNAPEDGDFWVTVHWQGDSQRTSEVQAVLIASVAIARYIQMHSLSAPGTSTNKELEVLENHFTVKTGNGLVINASADNVLASILKKAAAMVGRGAALAIARHLGL
jgi:hypothetical protein